MLYPAYVYAYLLHVFIHEKKQEYRLVVIEKEKNNPIKYIFDWIIFVEIVLLFVDVVSLFCDHPAVHNNVLIVGGEPMYKKQID